EPKIVRKNSFRPPVIKDWNSDDESKLKTAGAAVNTVRLVNTAGSKAVKTVKPVNTADSKPTLNRPRPTLNAFKRGHSQVTSPFNKYSTNKNSIFNKKVNIVSVNDTTTREREVETNAILLSMKILMVDLFPLEMVKAELLEKAEAVNTACYVLNRVLVIKPQNKTPYELIHGRPPLIDFMKPFGCPVSILNTRDHLGKFNEKADDGFFVGNKPDWLFDIDSLTISMNYVPVVAGHQTNDIAGNKDNIVADPNDSDVYVGKKAIEVDESETSDKGGNDEQATRSEFERLIQKEMQTEQINSTNSINTVSTPVSTDRPSFDNAAISSPVNTAGTHDSTANAFEEHHFKRFFPFKNAFSMHNSRIFGNAYDDEDVEEEVDMNIVVSSYTVPDAPSTKFIIDHPKDQVTRSLKTHVQKRHMTKINDEHGLISSVHKLRRTNHKDFQNCLFSCFLSQMEPKKLVQALKDPS
ncbi:putative ribonuclease H-like domain-containing protein, partial [Tanacetum coccineum]